MPTSLTSQYCDPSRQERRHCFPVFLLKKLFGAKKCNIFAPVFDAQMHQEFGVHDAHVTSTIALQLAATNLLNEFFRSLSKYIKTPIEVLHPLNINVDNTLQSPIFFYANCFSMRAAID